MKTETIKYKIGYIDEEAQWVDKFKRTFKEDFEIVGFRLSSHTSLENMIKQIEKAKLDCLIVDFELKEADIVQFNGDDIIEALREVYPYFPVFIITAKEEDDVLSQVDDNDIVRLKDELDTKPTILAQRINNKIISYYNDIDAAEKRIEELVSLKNSKGLTLELEEELTQLYQFLEQIYPNEKILPDNLIQSNSITKLNDFVLDTKKILKKLNEIENPTKAKTVKKAKTKKKKAVNKK